jgi:preprotein translocase subunit YajC
LTKTRIITIVFIGIMLVGMLLATSCLSPVATTTTTNADGTAATPSWFDQYGIFIFIVVIFGLMYLLMIRPQRKKQKEAQKLMEDLKRGDQVITTSGIYGTIESVEETNFVIKLEYGATMRVVKGAIGGKRPEN